MPEISSRRRSRKLPLLLFFFAALAAILWLLPLLSTHPILFPSGPSFEDILVYKGRFTLYHSAKFFTSRVFSGFAYPPGAAPIYEAFYRTADPVQTYLYLAAAATLASLLAAWLWLRRAVAPGLLLLLPLFSFPLVFLLQRANIELALWVVVAVGLLLSCAGAALPAAVLFGLAASVKLYPIFLLGLFLKRGRDLPAFAAGLLTALLSLFLACAYAGPTVSLAARGFFTGLGHFQDHYIDTVSQVEIAFDHSLFSPVKFWAYGQHLSPAPWRSTYYVCAAALALALFLRVRTLPTLNRIVFLVAAMVCLPPVSFTYTLVHLYLPMLLLLAALTASAKPAPTVLAALALLLFLMLPLVSLRGLTPLPTGPIQSFALLALLILCAITPWQDASTASTL
jgi:hypothetical protein